MVQFVSDIIVRMLKMLNGYHHCTLEKAVSDPILSYQGGSHHSACTP